MERFVRGDVVVIPFPYSDLSGSKRRPAFVLVDLPGNDIVLCQITSRANDNSASVLLAASDFVSGSLPVSSYIKPTKVFTADKSIIIRKAGTVKSVITEASVKILTNLLNQAN